MKSILSETEFLESLMQRLPKIARKVTKSYRAILKSQYPEYLEEVISEGILRLVRHGKFLYEKLDRTPELETRWLYSTAKWSAVEVYNRTMKVQKVEFSEHFFLGLVEENNQELNKILLKEALLPYFKDCPESLDKILDGEPLSTIPNGSRLKRLGLSNLLENL